MAKYGLNLAKVLAANEMPGRNGTGIPTGLLPHAVLRNLYVNGISSTDTAVGTQIAWLPGGSPGFKRSWLVRWNGASFLEVRGIVSEEADAEFVPVKYIFNANAFGAAPVLFRKHHSGAVAKDRIDCPGDVDFLLKPHSGVLLVFDTLSSHWVLVGSQDPTRAGYVQATLAANANDYTPISSNAWEASDMARIDCTVASDITGFDMSSLLVPLVGTFVKKKIINVGIANITLKHQDVLSVATNRLLNFTGADIVLQPDDSIDMLYDPITTRWRVGV